MYLVRYYSYQFTGTYWNLEKFADKEQALSYAKIVDGSVFIKVYKNKLENPSLVKIN